MTRSIETPDRNSIETMRGIAVLLLVSYHVVGGSALDGMRLDYPHFARILADLLVDVRMPFFAFVAGFVYSLKPIQMGSYFSFIQGKIRRLYIPGVIAAALFFLARYLNPSDTHASIQNLWRILFFPYEHYWFLQAILTIFVVFGAVDTLLKQRFVPAIFIFGLVLYICSPFIRPNFLSINQAIYLFPYFMLGLLFSQYHQHIQRWRNWIILVVGATAVSGFLWRLNTLSETGQMTIDRRGLYALITGMSLCALAYLTLPRIRWLESIGPVSFTIYLYHAFGTASSRELLMSLGVTNFWIIFTSGLAVGVAGPVLLHKLANQLSITRRLLLGQRKTPKTAMRDIATTRTRS